MIPTISTVLILLSLVAGLAYTLQVLYFNYGFKGHKARKPLSKHSKISVSVIVAARNEEASIAECVQSLLAQNYPAELLEIIIADDDSTDATLQILETFSNRAGNLSVIRLNSSVEQGKKAAITKAIMLAKNELIVTTDADCIVSPLWISTIASYYEQGAMLMLGPVVFNKENTLFEKIQSLEFMALMGITAGTANLQKPILCNAANMAYARSTFIANNGFENDVIVASGDDMLLLRKIKRKNPGAIVFMQDDNAVVKTKAQSSLKGFINQRKRWFSKSLVIPDRFTNTIAFFVYLICALTVINLFFALIWKSSDFLYCSLGLLIIKSMVDFILLYNVSIFFNKTKLLIYFPLAQVFIISYTLLVPFILFNKSYSWKSRTVK